MARSPGPSNKKPSRYNSYLRYSGLGLQLLVTIAVCGWLGYKADQYVGNKYPVFMLLLGFLGFGGSMYQIYRSINRPSQLIRFLIATAALTLILPSIVTLGFRRGWLAVRPSFLFETTLLVAFATAVIFLHLYRSKKPSFFVQLYLLTMAVKLIAFFGYNLIMILDDKKGAMANVLYFLLVYFIFTAVEIAFLYKRISGKPGP